MIPLHPQPCPGDPDLVRWIVPAGLLSVIGPVTAAPAPLAALLADGTLAGIVVEPAAVVTRLSPDRRWALEGPRVRTALHAALTDHTGWATVSGFEDVDALLKQAVRELLDGPTGEFARSHGGSIELVQVRDAVVTVRLAGACHGCPAARITLHQRLERQLRSRCPALRAVVDAAASPAGLLGFRDRGSHDGAGP